MEPGARRTRFRQRACRCIAPAGSSSFHHVRAVHGSAQNTLGASRKLLLYEFAAADACPLLGVPDWDEFNARLLVGAPTVVPRMVACPMRMPLPPARTRARSTKTRRRCSAATSTTEAAPVPRQPT